jgi:hypothetical protein
MMRNSGSANAASAGSCQRSHCGEGLLAEAGARAGFADAR